MNQKGFSLTIFVVCMMIVLVAILLGFLIVKKYYPPLTPDQSSNSRILDASSSSTEKKISVKETQDAARLANIENLKQIIESAILNSDINILCNGGQFPCFGDSRDLGATNIDGTGWIKIEFKTLKNSYVASLPLDPINDAGFHYVFCADQTGWEINTAFRSDTYLNRTVSDRGDDTDKYELGSNLQLINRIPECKY